MPGDEAAGGRDKGRTGEKPTASGAASEGMDRISKRRRFENSGERACGLGIPPGTCSQTSGRAAGTYRKRAEEIRCNPGQSKGIMREMLPLPTVGSFCCCIGIPVQI